MRWADVCAFAAFALTAAGAAGAQVPSTVDTCVDVRIGDARAYDCLNRALQRMVPRHRFSVEADAPVTATLPPNAVGTFSRAATEERLGTSFGHSVIPQRPAAVFLSPLPTAR